MIVCIHQRINVTSVAMDQKGLGGTILRLANKGGALINMRLETKDRDIYPMTFASIHASANGRSENEKHMKKLIKWVKSRSEKEFNDTGNIVFMGDLNPRLAINIKTDDMLKKLIKKMCKGCQKLAKTGTIKRDHCKECKYICEDELKFSSRVLLEHLSALIQESPFRPCEAHENEFNRILFDGMEDIVAHPVAGCRDCVNSTRYTETAETITEGDLKTMVKNELATGRHATYERTPNTNKKSRDYLASESNKTYELTFVDCLVECQQLRGSKKDR